MAITSAVVDLRTYRIPNILVAILLLAFLIVGLVHGSDVNWIGHVGAALLTFALGVGVYALGQMGAGDVKLLAAIALWAGTGGLVPLLIAVSLCGFVGMLLIIAMRIVVPRFQTSGTEGQGLPRVLVKGEGIPYGIGIGPGALIASFAFPSWLWHI
jgi:prepilin peptidase CpaA